MNKPTKEKRKETESKQRGNAPSLPFWVIVTQVFRDSFVNCGKFQENCHQRVIEQCMWFLKGTACVQSFRCETSVSAQYEFLWCSENCFQKARSRVLVWFFTVIISTRWRQFSKAMLLALCVSRLFTPVLSELSEILFCLLFSSFSHKSQR